jgi:hypothetical protein
MIPKAVFDAADILLRAGLIVPAISRTRWRQGLDLSKHDGSEH